MPLCLWLDRTNRFQKSLYQFICLSAVCEYLPMLNILIYLLPSDFLVLAKLVIQWCHIMILICIFLITKEVEHLFISFFCEVNVRTRFPHFSIEWYVSYLLFRSSFISGYKSSPSYVFANIFSNFMACFYRPLWWYFFKCGWLYQSFSFGFMFSKFCSRNPSLPWHCEDIILHYFF